MPFIAVSGPVTSGGNVSGVLAISGYEAGDGNDSGRKKGRETYRWASQQFQSICPSLHTLRSPLGELYCMLHRVLPTSLLACLLSFCLKLLGLK
jgi:hypothetical protein